MTDTTDNPPKKAAMEWIKTGGIKIDLAESKDVEMVAGAKRRRGRRKGE